MNRIYRVTIHGRVLESRNLRQLLSRAVAEKRDMDARCRITQRNPSAWVRGLLGPLASPDASLRQGAV